MHFPYFANLHFHWKGRFLENEDDAAVKYTGFIPSKSLVLTFPDLSEIQIIALIKNIESNHHEIGHFQCKNDHILSINSVERINPAPLREVREAHGRRPHSTQRLTNIIFRSCKVILSWFPLRVENLLVQFTRRPAYR